MGEFFSFALPSIPSGCTYALIAVGLVLAYRATGVFNFAFGAEAYAAGVSYAELILHGMNRVWAAVVVIFVFAPAFGALLDFGLFSRIPQGNRTARVVTSLGLMVLLPQVVSLLTNNQNIYEPPPVFFPPFWFTRIHGVSINAREASTMVLTAGVFILLALLLRTRRIGLPLRAAVESPKLLALDGVDSQWVLRIAWMITTSLAGVAGVIFASQYTQINGEAFAQLVVAAIAGAAIGGLRSLPLAAAGGILLGVVQGVVPGYLPPDSVWYSALVPSLPFFILLALLIFHPGLHKLEDTLDPMASVEPPPPPPALALRPPRLTETVHRFRWPALALALVATATYVPGPWIAALTIGVAFAMIFLSITLMTGIAGQLSLAQASFAGIGASVTAQLADAQHVSVLLAALAGALVAGLGGVIASLPALRLRGLPVALLTLCLALLADNLLFPTSWIGNGEYGLPLNRPRLFDIGMNAVDSRSFFVLCFVVLLALTGAVHTLLRGTTGRALSAVHASPVGAASSGVSVRRLTILLFMLSAGIAGLGGAFYAMAQQSENPVDFSWQWGPTFLVIVVTVGVSSVEGAIEAGIGYALLNQLFTYLPARLSGSSSGEAALTIVVLSLGAFTYARHPEGIVEFGKRKVAQVVFRAKAPPPATVEVPG